MQRLLPSALAVTVVLAACATAPEETASTTSAGDAMTPELRARAERLEAEVTASPTTRETVAGRARLLWEWANALALEGVVLPVNVTTIPARVARAQASGEEIPPPVLAALDGYVRELGIKQREPGAIGDLEANAAEPLPAGHFVTVEETYTVGALPMAEGGAVLLGRQLMADQGALQHQDPAADDYVSIRASDPDARWVPIEVPLAGMHGGFRGAEPMPAFRLEGTSLEPGATFTLVFGDRSGGSRGFRVQSFSTDQLLLPVYIDLEGRGVFFTPRWPPLRVAGGAVEAVSAVVPSVVAVGEAFDLRLRSEDRFYNRATGPKPAYRIELEGERVATVPAGGNALASVHGLAILEPGVYRYRVRSEDGALETNSNPIWVREAPEQRIFWGETHGHTGMAEGQGSAGRYYTWARDDARLDFAGLSEHDVWLDDAEWREMQRLARRSTEDGRFVALLGYEWTTPRALGGHHNVFFRTPDKERVAVQEAPTLPDLYEGLHERVAPEETLVIPHAHQAADWTRSDADLQRLVEIYSMHGTFEWFGNLYLENGFEVGFIAASDDHRARPGYAHGQTRAPLAQWGGLAAVLAPEATIDAVFDGLRSLRAYATSGPRILLDVTLNGRPMGTRQRFAERREILLRAMGTAPIDHIDVIKNGDVVYSSHYLGAPLRGRAWIQIGFESSSEVFRGRDNPRPYRVWEGTLEVEGAELLRVRPVGFENPYLERASIDEAVPSRVRFRTETRGRRDVLLLELDGATPATTLSFVLEPTREYGFAPILVRPPAEIPRQELRLSLGDLVDSRLQRELRVGEHVDRIRVQVVDPERPFDRDFELTDLDSPAPGDYYYLRVTQLDGGRAWSSPFWVGGSGAQPP